MLCIVVFFHHVFQRPNGLWKSALLCQVSDSSVTQTSPVFGLSSVTRCLPVFGLSSVTQWLPVFGLSDASVAQSLPVFGFLISVRKIINGTTVAKQSNQHPCSASTLGPPQVHQTTAAVQKVLVKHPGPREGSATWYDKNQNEKVKKIQLEQMVSPVFLTFLTCPP